MPSEQIRIDYSDDDLQVRVAQFLKSRHFPVFRKLKVDVNHGAVTLSGNVHSYYEKQVALTSCQRVAGVLSLVDEVAVEQSDPVDRDDAPRMSTRTKPK